MWKALAVSAGILTLIGSSPAWSQAQPAPGGSQPPAAAAVFPSADDIAALADSRMAALKSGLKIKPDQEKNWASFETVVRDLSKQRTERLAQLVKESQNAPKTDIVNPADVLRLRAKSMSQAAADLGRYAEAIDPLFKSLDDAQKRRFLVLLAGR